MCFRFYLANQISIFNCCKLCVKRYAGTALFVGNALKTPHKVQMPVGSAEFSIGDHMITGSLLLCYNIADRIVDHGV